MCTVACTAAACSDGFVQDGIDEQCDDGPDNADNAACTTECKENVCGDGNVFNTGDGDEACDNGDDNGPGQLCNATCQLNVCGDNDKSPDEECDDGNLDAADGCSATCVLEGCGNEILDPGETCDDGKNGDNDDDCTDVCQLPKCGDSLIQPSKGETCDDGGNNSDTAACTAACIKAKCGDGLLFAQNEQCDDGPDNGPGKACLASCQKNVCGDGDIGPGESCDDGNMIDDDDCTNVCKAAKCGDGIKQANEQCDKGMQNADEGACTLACTLPVCGDGFVQPSNNETCDDSNQLDTDACTAACKPAKCGDQIVWAGMEDCDDGDMDNLDECTNGCKAPSCSDGLKNQGEADVDCGGGGCKPCSVAGLVINEVDYDQPGGDTAEFIEILNTTNAAINLTGYNLYVINCGLNPPAPAATISIASAGMIAPGQYLVVGPDSVVVPPEALKIKSGTALENGAPDGIVLAETVGKTVRDVLSYEGACATATLPVIGMVPMVEGMAANFADTGNGTQSLIRNPNGYDGNNLATDWAVTTTLTPGAANVP